MRRRQLGAGREPARRGSRLGSGRRGTSLAGLTAAFLLLLGCDGGGTDPTIPPRQILLVAVEAMSWERIDELSAAGQLPNLSRLVREGARAKAIAPDPLEPLALWATALTGKTRARHKMTGGLVQLPSGRMGLAPSAMRQSPHLFQMAGLESGIVASVAVPGTWPAEIVNGFLVADGYTPNRWVQGTEHTYVRKPGEMATWPPSLWDEIQPFIVTVEDLKREEASRFFTLNESEFEMLYDKPMGSLLRHENPLRDFGLTHQADQSNVAIARYLQETYRPRLVGVHLGLCSSLQPVYWAFSRPELYPTISADSHRRFRGTVDEAYRFIDEKIGELMELLPANSTVVIVGNHGFTDAPDPLALSQGENRLRPMASNEAVLILHGQGIARGVDLGRTHLADLAPTILALLGDDVGADMDGQALKRAFTPRFREANPVGVLESYDLEWDPAHRFPDFESEKPGPGADGTDQDAG